MKKKTTSSLATGSNGIVHPHIISNIVYISNMNHPDTCVADSCIDISDCDDCEMLMSRFAEGINLCDTILGIS